MSRIPILVVCVLMVSAASWALMATKPVQEESVLAEAGDASPAVEVEETLLPPHREPPPPPPLVLQPPPPQPEKASPKPAPVKARASVAASPQPPPAAPVVQANVQVYANLGGWIDVYDFIHDPAHVMTQMKQRGVRTLYLQSGRYRDPADIINPARFGEYIDQAHLRGIAVVCWYLPGFGDISRDLHRTKAALDYRSPAGGGCDGFAPDIETGEFAHDRARFNAGVEEYTNRIREVAGDRPLGAIVVDAKNNERAPAKWAGFPWGAIGRVYNIILPMAYWTVTKRGNCAAEYDTFAYINQVVDKTNALMGVNKPYHMIGGIADCQTVAETSKFVQAVKARGLLGGSLYDYVTTQSSPHPIWAELAHLN